jgi:hypothetical protein
MGNIINITNKYDHNVYVTGPSETRRIEGQPIEQSGDVSKKDKVSLSKASQDKKPSLLHRISVQKRLIRSNSKWLKVITR